eukprot:3192971-Rhodomonas_salina.1
MPECALWRLDMSKPLPSLKLQLSRAVFKGCTSKGGWRVRYFRNCGRYLLNNFERVCHTEWCNPADPLSGCQ